MFGRKRERLRRAIEQAEQDLRAESPLPHGPGNDPVTSPLADLCQDITENPERYEPDGAAIRAKGETALWIYSNGAAANCSCFQTYPTDVEQVLICKTAALFWDGEKHRKAADLVARLAKLKADRDAVDTSAESLQSALDAFIRDDTTADQDVILINAVRQMLPVFEGTHWIVAVEQPKFGAPQEWVDELKTNIERQADVPITISTPGDDRPVMRDFLTDPRRSPVKYPIDHRIAMQAHMEEGDYQGWAEYCSNNRWMDQAGWQHWTRSQQRDADKPIEAKRRKRKAGAP